MEMKEIYPRLPTAPLIIEDQDQDQGQRFTKNKRNSSAFRKGSSN